VSPSSERPWEIPVRSCDDINKALLQAAQMLEDKAARQGVPTDGDLWYRGCARESYALLPSLLRFDNGLAVELQLYDRFTAKWKLSHWRALFDMQHSFIPTRLLDWTTEPEVAKYFALSPDDAVNPTVSVLHPGLLNLRAFLAVRPPFRVNGSEFQYPRDYCPPNSTCRDLPIAVWPDQDQAHSRIGAQDGVFTVHGRKPLPIEQLCPEAVVKVVLRGRMPETGKEAYRKQTARYFPDKSGWAVTLCESFALKPFPERRISNLLIQVWEDNREILLGNSKNMPSGRQP